MNIGIVGCGRAAWWHALIYKHMHDVRITAFCDSDIKKARAFAHAFSVEKTFSDYHDLLDLSQLDMVDICTPTASHASIACDAAKTGHHIFLEKPMARDRREGEMIVSDANKNNVRFCVCHNQLYKPSILQAKAILESRNNDLVSFTTFVHENPSITQSPAWTFTTAEKGILWEAGYHLAYLHNAFLSDIIEVDAVGKKVRHPVYDDFTVLLRTSQGPYGVMNVSWICQSPEMRYTLEMADGDQIHINPELNMIVKSSPYASFGFHKWIQKISYSLRYAKSLQDLIDEWKYRYFIGHYYLLKEYIRRLRNDLPSPVSSGDALQSLCLLECIEQSMEEHRSISVPRNISTFDKDK